jgi:hypothetical protein
LTPKLSIQVVTDGANPAPIPILAARVIPDGSRAIIIAHGTLLKPTLEKIVSYLNSVFGFLKILFLFFLGIQ